MVTTMRPTLRWELTAVTTGARVEICRERACATIEQTIDATGTRATPTIALSSGIHFWRLFPRTSTTVGAIAGPVWEFQVGARTTPIDTSWGTVSDVNGDGIGDLISVAVPTSAGGGRALVFFGAPGGLPPAPSQVLTRADTPTRAFADVLAIAPDVNGDGFADFVVGVDESVKVFLGSASGIASSPVSTVVNPISSGAFGHVVDGAGDVNGDGYGDVIAGDEWTARAYIYFGSPTGIPSAPSVTLFPPMAPPGGSVDYARDLGHAGDVNGDGFADVWINLYQISASGGSAFSCLHYGAAGGVETTSCVRRGPGSLTHVACLDDVNGDGFADVGATTNVFTAVVATLGSSAGLGLGPTDVVWFRPSGAPGGFGRWFSPAGDMDADGLADVVVTSPGSLDAYVYRGIPSGAALVADWTLTTLDDSTGHYGDRVAGARDLNADGFPDIIVGSPTFDTSRGRAYVYCGAIAGPPSMPSVTLSWGVGAEFGTLLALLDRVSRRSSFDRMR